MHCGTEMAAYMLEEHMATCIGGRNPSSHAQVASHDNWAEPAQCEVSQRLAMERCVMCGESFDRAALPSHKAECPCRILACPLGCGQEGQSYMLDLHVSKYCPKRGMALATSKGAPPAAAPKGVPTPKQLVTLPLVGPPINHALPDARVDASHLLVAGVKSKPANVHVTPTSTVAAAAGLEPGASAPLELNLSKAAQAPPKAESAVGPHPTLLLIREGIAAQNKDSVRSAMAMAIKAQVPIEPKILTMLQQWLGDEQLPSAHQPAGSPPSSGCSVTSQSTLCETATPVVARASVQGTCLPHTAKAHRVAPDGSDACGQPDSVGTPHPALLMIRDGIASQCKTTVRAALAAATKAQVHIEPQVHTMLMQWLGDDVSQAPGAAPVSAQTESGVSWQPPAFSASATAPTSVEPAPVPAPVSMPAPVPAPGPVPVAPVHVPAAAPMFREGPAGRTGLVPPPVSNLDTDGLPPDAAQALAELLAEVGREPAGAAVPGTVIARPPVITRPPVLVKPEAERNVPSVDTSKTEDAPALAQGIRASRDEEGLRDASNARRPEGQKRRQSPAAEKAPAKRANIPETTSSESNGKVPEAVPFREREETVVSSAKRKKDVTESKPFKEKDTGLREAWEYMAAGNQWGAGNFFNFDSF